jgi:hypothetical protein
MGEAKQRRLAKAAGKPWDRLTRMLVGYEEACARVIELRALSLAALKAVMSSPLDDVKR